MSKYVISKLSNSGKINVEKLQGGYVFKPKKTNEKLLSVSKATMYNQEIIDEVLTVKFNQLFRRVVLLAYSVLNDDDASDDDCNIVLGEVELVKSILKNRYHKQLSYEKEQNFYKKLHLIELEMRNLQVRIKQNAIFLEFEQSIGRGK